MSVVTVAHLQAVQRLELYTSPLGQSCVWRTMLHDWAVVMVQSAPDVGGYILCKSRR